MRWGRSVFFSARECKKKKSKKTREQIIEEEMVMVDSLSENIMIQLIQSLKENSVDITSTEFVRDIAFC